MNKFKLILSLGIAAALTMSCTETKDEAEEEDQQNTQGGGGGSNTGTTETYTLLEIDEDSGYFTYKDTYTGDEYCEDGELETPTYDNEVTVMYSLNGNRLTLTPYYSDEGFEFKGSSTTLAGAWTRTKNATASCGYGYGGYYDEYGCPEGYDIIKVVFSSATLPATFEVTRQECPTDEFEDGSTYYNGWIQNVVDCNTIKYSNGSDNVTQKLIREGDTYATSITYNGKTCSNARTTAQKQTACTQAYETDGYYGEILYNDYFDCLLETLPASWSGEEECSDYDDCYWEEDYGYKKAPKFKPLLKNKKK